jgi:hypothetical protein
LWGNFFCRILKKELKVFHHNFNLDFREGKFVAPKKKSFKKDSKESPDIKHSKVLVGSQTIQNNA